MTPFEKLIRAQRARGVEEPEFHLHGTIDVWLKIDEDGTVVGLDFDRDSFEPKAPGLSFTRDASGDDRDLTADEQETAADGITGWALTRIEDADGAVWMDT